MMDGRGRGACQSESVVRGWMVSDSVASFFMQVENQKKVIDWGERR